MTSTEPSTVFVCGPTLKGEVLKSLTVRNGFVVWEGGAEPAPMPAEPIRDIHHLPVADRLILVETESGLYLTTIDDLIDQPL